MCIFVFYFIRITRHVYDFVCVWCVCVCVCSLNSITQGDGKRSSVKSVGSEGSGTVNCSLHTVDFKCFKATWNEEVHQNREKWKTQATKGGGNVAERNLGQQNRAEHSRAQQSRAQQN